MIPKDRIALDIFWAFSKLPILGKLLGEKDGIYFENYTQEEEISLDGKFLIAGKEIKFKVIKPEKEEGGEETSKKKREWVADDDDEVDDTPAEIKWIVINKSVRVVTIKKIGLQLEGTSVKAYVDAEFSIGIIKADFLELYADLPMKKDDKVSFGLQGVVLNYESEVISITGGLYKVPDENDFAGILNLKVPTFSFLAQGALGVTEDGDFSFFAYLALLRAIGGPDFFFVTGLALGIGINRAIKLPEYKEVTSFPFVKAVLDGGSGLGEDTSPGEALAELSDWIKPQSGEYFLTAGVKFISFGILESFALLTMEFGKSIRVSLLGTTKATFPPLIDQAKISPIASAEMAIQVSFDVSGGLFEVVGGLTNNTYIIDKDCSVTGGFAYCIWFSGENAGDFLITLGGCHYPNYKNDKYPEIDKLEINWLIGPNLKWTGNGYFAITPACMMAGADFSITYEVWALKAWFHAAANFMIQWKPFFYQADISVSLGATFTVKIWFIHISMTVEVGASLKIWGPSFSGKAYVKLAVITIKIPFGNASPEPIPIQWKEFAASFLESKDSNNVQANGGRAASDGVDACKVQISDGLTKIDKDSNKPYVLSDKVSVTARSKIPFEKWEYNGGNPTTVYNGKFGIVPMGKKNFDSILNVSIEHDSQIIDRDHFNYSILYDNVPAGLWAACNPRYSDSTVKNTPIGMTITPKKHVCPIILPPTGSYDMKTLLDNERIKKNFSWQTEAFPNNIVCSDKDALDTIKKSLTYSQKRASVMHLLAATCGTMENVNFKNIQNSPENYFLANPVLRTQGAVGAV